MTEFAANTIDVAKRIIESGFYPTTTKVYAVKSKNKILKQKVKVRKKRKELMVLIFKTSMLLACSILFSMLTYKLLR